MRYFNINNLSNDNDVCTCKVVNKKLSLQKIKQDLETEVLKQELEQHFFNVLTKE